MILNKASVIVSLLSLELIVYSLRFVKLEPEEKFLPSSEALITISDHNGYKKLNSSCFSPPNFNFNQVNLLNSQNINGYNPIFPKRLLKIVNASLGRETNWVETVSLSTESVNGNVFMFAGVVPCIKDGKNLEMPSPQNNIFSKLDMMDDEVFYSLVKNQPEDVGRQSLIVLKSDEIIMPKTSENSCFGKSRPEVKETGVNEIQIKSVCDFFYVNPQLYYQGWVMFDDRGKIGKAFPAFGFLQGYKIPAGERKIRFEYRPFSFMNI